MRHGANAILTALILLTACHQQEEKTPLVQVGNNTLYMEELSSVLPRNMSKADSALWAEDYTNKWIRKELLVQKAEDNLTPTQKDVQQELTEYRNSLLTYRYKNELMKQKMDTLVPESEIRRYYMEHEDKFILQQDIIKAILIKVPIAIADPRLIKKMCADEDPALNEYCISYAKAYDKFDDNWVAAKYVFNNTPSPVDDLQRVLRDDRFIENKDSEFYYLVYIKDFHLTGEAAPLDYVENQVKNLILNTRKIQFLKKIDEEVYKEGIDNKRVKLFNIQK